MEALRFGFDPAMPPAFKFDPTDDDLVAHYLLPRALGILNPPFAHAIIDADPASLPPPDLLALHGHAASHQAFFFDVTTKKGGNRERVVKGGAGGLWRGQQGHYFTLTLLRPGGGEVDIKYKRYDLTYKTFDEETEERSKKRKRTQGGAPSGWVMHEYSTPSSRRRSRPPSSATYTSPRARSRRASSKPPRQQRASSPPSSSTSYNSSSRLQSSSIRMISHSARSCQVQATTMISRTRIKQGRATTRISLTWSRSTTILLLSTCPTPGSATAAKPARNSHTRNCQDRATSTPQCPTSQVQATYIILPTRCAVVAWGSATASKPMMLPATATMAAAWEAAF
jgi:hypothetical protein